MQSGADNKSVSTQRQSLEIDNIEILELIGSGGMSQVFKARQVDLDRIVALKVLLAQSFDDESLRRFQNEARITSTLMDKNVVQILTFGVSKDYHAYIVMEFIEGKSLANLLKTEGRLRLSRFRRIFLDILSALENAHQLRLVHRDIKPGNIMICKNDEGEEVAKLVDFGIAKLVAEANEQSQKLTKTGALIGSPLYMSPEQCLGKPLDARSDLYSLSCVMFEALSGEPPFSGDSVLDLMHKHATQAPPTVQSLRGKVEIVQELAELVIRGLAKDPAARPQTARDLSEGLKLAFDGVTLDKVPKMQAAKSSKSVPPKLVMFLVMALFVLVSVFFFSSIFRRGSEAKLKEISPDSKLKEGMKLVHDAENLARVRPLDKVESMYEKAIVLLQGQKDPEAKKDLGKALMSAAQDLEILNGLQGQKNRKTNPALRAKIDSYYNKAISIAKERRDLSEYYAALAAKFGSMSYDKSTIKERLSMLKDAESVLKDSQYIDLICLKSEVYRRIIEEGSASEVEERMKADVQNYSATANENPLPYILSRANMAILAACRGDRQQCDQEIEKISKDLINDQFYVDYSRREAYFTQFAFSALSKTRNADLFEKLVNEETSRNTAMYERKPWFLAEYQRLAATLFRNTNNPQKEIVCLELARKRFAPYLEYNEPEKDWIDCVSRLVPLYTQIDKPEMAKKCQADLAARLANPNRPRLAS